MVPCDDDLTSGDTRFTGSIPEVYQRLLVPLIFAEPAAHLAETVAGLAPSEVLETAAGTGVLTRELRRRLPDATIVATDLNDAMMATAREQTGLDGVRWQQADALALPFEEDSFDAVACQFGVMFFPDRPAGHLQAGRVLRPGGALVFNVWGSLAANPVAEAVSAALERTATESPPRFLSRTPYGYSDLDLLHSDVEAAGMSADIQVVTGTNRGTSIEIAVAFCQGTPLRAEIEAHPTLSLEQATAAAADLVARRWGGGVIELPARWIEVVARST